MNMKHEWKVQVTAAELLKAALAKRDHHAERLKHWQEQRDAAEIKLRSEGVEFRETGGSYSNSSKAGGVAVVVDPQLQKAFEEARGKVDEHWHLTERYARWASFFGRATPSSSFECDYDAFDELGL